VYKLCGFGPDGTSVVAKRSKCQTAAVEALIYQKILPQLPLSAPQFYGLVSDEDPKFCWLFLEDVGEQRYSSERQDHRAIAARWLATLHSSAIPVAAAAALPDRGPRFYLEQLKRVSDAVRKSIGKPILSGDDRKTLQSIVSDCNRLHALWDQVQKACDRIPCT
jgi:hypothetical protein